MLLNIITIVLRETLEAGVLVSILLSIANQQQMRLHWLVVAFSLGTLGAFTYAMDLEVISQWFDYVGQEVINSMLQYCIYLCLLYLMVILRFPVKDRAMLLYPCMVLVVALALVREGSEIIVFYSGYLQTEGVVVKAFTSGFVGLALGLCVGAVVYYVLMLSPARFSYSLQKVLLMLVGAGMVIQATQLLLQADWLPSSLPVWNTNDFLLENSILGQLVYAVFGYEATPSSIEVYFYIVAIVLFLSVPYLIERFFIKKGLGN